MLWYILDVPGGEQHGQPAEREQPLPAVNVAEDEISPNSGVS